MDKFGCQVYSFDPSIGVENHNRTKNIHFYNIGLSGMDGINSSGWKMKTASSIYKMLAKSHGSSTLIDVFKMDIEYSEWDASIPQMLRTGFLAEKVKQLAVEIHFNASDTLDNFQRRVGILQDLEGNGNFIRFSSRPNPWLLRSISILGDRQEYIGLELAWYNSRYYNGPWCSYFNTRLLYLLCWILCINKFQVTPNKQQLFLFRIHFQLELYDTHDKFTLSTAKNIRI